MRNGVAGAVCVQAFRGCLANWSGGRWTWGVFRCASAGGGDSAAATDVTQAVFVELARQARRLVRHPALNGWLYTAARRMALRHVRTEARRRHREQEALEMKPTRDETGMDAEWAQILPVLDEAMDDLNERTGSPCCCAIFGDAPSPESAPGNWPW